MGGNDTQQQDPLGRQRRNKRKQQPKGDTKKTAIRGHDDETLSHPQKLTYTAMQRFHAATHLARLAEPVKRPPRVELQRYHHVNDERDRQVPPREDGERVVDGRLPLPTVEQAVLARLVFFIVPPPKKPRAQERPTAKRDGQKE